MESTNKIYVQKSSTIGSSVGESDKDVLEKIENLTQEEIIKLIRDLEDEETEVIKNNKLLKDENNALRQVLRNDLDVKIPEDLDNKPKKE